MFITLTYDTAHVPITPRGFMALSKRDCQLFFKRLRKAHGKTAKAIKYYIAGEYGGKTDRPHYHAIIFNAKQELIQDAWQNGQVHYGFVSGASVGYTLKYISKKGRIPMHKNDDRPKEFALMSKGLGKEYITEQIKAWHREDLENRMYVPLMDGKKASMPRYYKDRIYTEEQRQRIAEHYQERLHENEVKFIENMTPQSIHNRKESIRQAFETMRAKAIQNDKI